MTNEFSTDSGAVDTPTIHPYSAYFDKDTATAKYSRKFLKRIEILRHEAELMVLQRYAKGCLFDCSIAIGRLIGRLSLVSHYSGMDYSSNFVAHIARTFPQVAIQRGNLRVGIDQPDGSFDTVICLRTLSALGSLQPILTEMMRIARPGGTVIFDYGVAPSAARVEGVDVTLDADADDVDAIVSVLPTAGVELIPLDGLFGLLKRSATVSRLVNSRLGGILPRAAWLRLERLFCQATSERILYVLTKLPELPA
jgi:SAM-dependent methyltransferase